jgi:hypothetical protein
LSRAIAQQAKTRPLGARDSKQPVFEPLMVIDDITDGLIDSKGWIHNKHCYWSTQLIEANQPKPQIKIIREFAPFFH